MKKYLLGVVTVVLTAGLAAQVLAAPPLPTVKPGAPARQAARIKAKPGKNRMPADTQSARMKNLLSQLRAEMKKKPVNREKIAELNRQIDIENDTLRIQRLQKTLSENPKMRADEKKRYNLKIQRLRERLTKKQTTL